MIERSDIEMIFAVIKLHAYIFWGDPGEMYRRVEGYLMYSEMGDMGEIRKGIKGRYSGWI